MSLKTSDFYYDLPKELIAQHPLEDRSSSRLLIANRYDKNLKEDIFKNIINYLNKGDVLVINNTKVIPARIHGHRKDKEENIEILLLTRKGDIWECLVKPGNIGDIDRTKAVVDACKAKNIPIRIGVNGGSLEKSILEKYGHACPEAMVESALGHIKILEDLDFHDIVISLKNSDIRKSVEAYRLMSEKVDYPLHLGITESGGVEKGTIKSSIGVGSLLVDGIGDTIRISLTGDPREEIKVGKQILRSIGLLNDKIKIVSCPTCGRCNIDLIKFAGQIEKEIEDIEKDITVAVMGCAVNGPGEAREADIGVAGGDGMGLLFKKGEIVKRIPEDEIVSTLLEEIDKL